MLYQDKDLGFVPSSRNSTAANKFLRNVRSADGTVPSIFYECLRHNLEQYEVKAEFVHFQYIHPQLMELYSQKMSISSRYICPHQFVFDTN